MNTNQPTNFSNPTTSGGGRMLAVPASAVNSSKNGTSNGEVGQASDVTNSFLYFNSLVLFNNNNLSYEQPISYNRRLVDPFTFYLNPDSMDVDNYIEDDESYTGPLVKRRITDVCGDDYIVVSKPLRCEVCWSDSCSGCDLSHAKDATTVINLFVKTPKMLRCLQAVSNDSISDVLQRIFPAYDCMRNNFYIVIGGIIVTDDVLVNDLNGATIELRFRLRGGVINCPECKKEFKSVALMSHHLAQRHGNVASSSKSGDVGVFCRGCNKEFKDEHVLSLHQCSKVVRPVKSGNKGKSKVNDPVKPKVKIFYPFWCGPCRLAFDTQPLLTVHLKTIHKKKFNLKCALCDYESTDKEDLRGHQRNHINNVPKNMYDKLSDEVNEDLDVQEDVVYDTADVMKERPSQLLPSENEILDNAIAQNMEEFSSENPELAKEFVRSAMGAPKPPPLPKVEFKSVNIKTRFKFDCHENLLLYNSSQFTDVAAFRNSEFIDRVKGDIEMGSVYPFCYTTLTEQVFDTLERFEGGWVTKVPYTYLTPVAGRHDVSNCLCTPQCDDWFNCRTFVHSKINTLVCDTVETISEIGGSKLTWDYENTSFENFIMSKMFMNLTLDIVDEDFNRVKLQGKNPHFGNHEIQLNYLSYPSLKRRAKIEDSDNDEEGPRVKEFIVRNINLNPGAVKNRLESMSSSVFTRLTNWFNEKIEYPQDLDLDKWTWVCDIEGDEEDVRPIPNRTKEFKKTIDPKHERWKVDTYVMTDGVTTFNVKDIFYEKKTRRWLPQPADDFITWLAGAALRHLCFKRVSVQLIISRSLVECANVSKFANMRDHSKILDSVSAFINSQGSVNAPSMLVHMNEEFSPYDGSISYLLALIDRVISTQHDLLSFRLPSGNSLNVSSTGIFTAKLTSVPSVGSRTTLD